MREYRLSWIKHIMKKDDSEALSSVIEMNIECKRAEERKKKNKWIDGRKNNIIKIYGVNGRTVDNRDL